MNEDHIDTIDVSDLISDCKELFIMNFEDYKLICHRIHEKLYLLDDFELDKNVLDEKSSNDKKLSTFINQLEKLQLLENTSKDNNSLSNLERILLESEMKYRQYKQGLNNEDE